MLGSHRLFQKMCMYEESVRTPVYLKFPKNHMGGRNIQTPVSQVDLMPTLCGYLGIKPRHEPDGTSLLPMIEGAEGGRDIMIQFDGNGSRSNFQRCILRGGYKLIVDLFKDETYYELYNVLKDPQETCNLLFGEESREMQQIAASMLEALGIHMEDTKDPVRITDRDLKTFVETYSNLSQGTM